MRAPVDQDLWVVVPAYDEEATLPATLAALAHQTDDDFTLVVVDNGSRDRTAVIAGEFARTVPSLPTAP